MFLPGDNSLFDESHETISAARSHCIKLDFALSLALSLAFALALVLALAQN